MANKSTAADEKKSWLKKILEKLKKLVERSKAPTLFQKYEEIQKNLNEMVEQNEVSTEALKDLYSITAEMEGKLGGMEEEDKQTLETGIREIKKSMEEEAAKHHTEITGDICQALSDASDYDYNDVKELLSDSDTTQIFTSGTDTYISLGKFGSFKANVVLEEDARNAFVLFEKADIPENAQQYLMENDTESTLISALNQTYAEKVRSDRAAEQATEGMETTSPSGKQPKERKTRLERFRDKYANGAENQDTFVISKLFEDNSFRLRYPDGNMLVVFKKAEGEYRTSLYRNTSPSLTINGASSEIGVWKSENGRISANFTLPNEPSVSILFHSAEMKEYLQTIGVPKDMIQQLSDNTSNGKSERVNKADFEKVQKLYDTIRDSFDNGVNQMGEVVADHCLSMHHPTFGKGHTYINLKPEGVLRDVLSIGFDRNGTPTTLNYKPNANGRFEPIYNLITNDFVGETGAKLYGTNPDFHRAMQRIIKSIDKTSAYQAASLPNPKAEEMKRAGDVVSRSFQSKSKYSALNQERTGVMQEWYKAAILMGAATELGDTALRNSAMQIMQNVVEGHTGSQKGFKNMVELMEKSETYKMEMARFQAKDLKEIFSQDCTQEMRGSKDNNTLFQDAIRNLAGRIGGAEAMTAIAAAQHFQQEQVEKELQAQKQERKPKKSYGKSGSEERT